MSYTQTQINFMFRLVFKGNESLFTGLTLSNLNDRVAQVVQPLWNNEVDRHTLSAGELNSTDFDSLIFNDAVGNIDDLWAYPLPEYDSNMLLTWKNEGTGVISTPLITQTKLDAFLATL